MDTLHKIQPKNSKGFTLIELMIAMVILVAGLVTILGSMLSMHSQEQYADQKTMAINYMSFLLEDLEQSAENNGDITDVTSYSHGDFGNLFVPEGQAVQQHVPGLGYIKVHMIQKDLGATHDTVEVQIILAVQDNRGRTIPYSTSKIITY